MSKLTRLGFLKRTSVGAASVGLLATVPGLAEFHDPSEVEAAELTRGHDGALIAYVRHVPSGEIALLSGERRIVIRDRKLVARLIKATR